MDEKKQNESKKLFGQALKQALTEMGVFDHEFVSDRLVGVLSSDVDYKKERGERLEAPCDLKVTELAVDERRKNR